MTQFHSAWVAEQQRRWLRPNAHLYWRPDAARVLPAHLHHLLPPQLRPSAQDGYDRARPNIATWTGKRGRWTPERDVVERAQQERGEALERRRELSELRVLGERKSAIAKLRCEIAFERFKRAALRRAIAEHLLRKAGFRPDQPRWPAGSGRISGRWSGGAGTGGPVVDAEPRRTVAPVADPEARRASPTFTDETPDNTWKPGAQYAATGHHWTPQGVFNKEKYSFRPETRKVLYDLTTGPLSDRTSNWFDEQHRLYNKAVEEALDSFLARHNIRSDQMTPDQARSFIRSIIRSGDPRIGPFVRRMIFRELQYFLRRGPRSQE